MNIARFAARFLIAVLVLVGVSCARQPDEVLAQPDPADRTGQPAEPDRDARP